MERLSLIKLVNEIMLSTGTEEEVDNLVSLFLKNIADPNALDYIYSKEYEGLTSEQIVDKALSYKPFCS